MDKSYGVGSPYYVAYLLAEKLMAVKSTYTEEEIKRTYAEAARLVNLVAVK